MNSWAKMFQKKTTSQSTKTINKMTKLFEIVGIKCFGVTEWRFGKGVTSTLQDQKSNQPRKNEKLRRYFFE